MEIKNTKRQKHKQTTTQFDNQFKHELKHTIKNQSKHKVRLFKNNKTNFEMRYKTSSTMHLKAN